MIKALSTECRVQELCEALAVSPSGYYEWAGRKPGKRQEANQELAQKIQLVYADSRKTYGSPRIALTLQKQGVACGRKRVARLMKQHDIQGAQKARYKPRTTDSNHVCPSAPTGWPSCRLWSESTRYGWVTSPTSLLWRGGCIWRPSWT